MKSCFIALTVPKVTRQRLLVAQEKLVFSDKGNVGFYRLSPEANLHLTLKFLGNSTERQIQDISGELQKLSARWRVSPLELEGVGAFDSLRSPRFLFAAVGQGTHSVNELIHEVEQLCVPFGFKPSPRPPVPHVTLARVSRDGIRENLFTKGLADWLKEHDKVNFGPIFSHALSQPNSHGQMALYESRFTRSVQRFGIIEAFDLRLPEPGQNGK